MTDELPKCKLCGQEPTHLSGGRVSHICVTPEAEWRRLHGPRLAPEYVSRLRALREECVRGGMYLLPRADSGAGGGSDMSGYDFSAAAANELLEAADQKIEALQAENKRLRGPHAEMADSRRAFSREEMIEEAKAYMRDTWGPCRESEDRDLWHERLGMLVDFIHDRFPSNASGVPPAGSRSAPPGCSHGGGQ